MFRTRWIRKLFAHQRRRPAAKPRKPVRLMLESLEERVTPCDSTSLVPGNCIVNFYGNAQSPQCTIPVTVNDNAGGVATSGTVNIYLVNGHSTITLGSATVDTNGVADVDINLGALPANLSIGSFQLEENFAGNSHYFSCNGSGTLTVSNLTTTIVPTSVTFNCTNTSTVTTVGNTVIPIGADADNYAVLFEGTGGNTLHISNTTINGNVGVGGTGVVQCDGHADLDGTLDFAGSGSGKFSGSGDQDDDDGGDDDGHGNDNGKDHGNGNDNGHGNKDDDDDSNQECIGPNAINVNDAAVTNALNAINALSSSLAGLGASIAINGTQTINESDGQLVTVNGVSYRVFNVTSYQMGDNDVLTINGDGSGIPVVFDFGGKGDVNLSGDVVLTNGLAPDQVLWNVTSSGANVHLHGNDSDRPCSAFQGIILAPNDTIDLDNANLIGRVFGGDSSDMQIVGQNTITAPATVITIPGSTSSSFTISTEVNCSSGAVSGGTVTFDVVAGNETIDLGTATVGANGVATLTVTNQATLQELASLLPGNYELIENYSGSGPFSGCSTTTTLTATPEQTTIVVPVNVTVSDSTTFNISVNVNTSNGAATSGAVTIDLVNGNQTIQLGTATVGANGVATLTVTSQAILQELASLPSGTYQLVVNYAGNGPFAGCSATSSLTITPEQTTIVVPSNVNVTVNNNTSFNISVNVNTSSGPATSGAVTLDLVNGNQTIQLGTATVGTNGVATLTVTNQAILQELASLPSGTYQLVVNYSGNGPFAGCSATSTLTLTVPATITVPPNVNVTVNNTTFNITVNVNTSSGPATSGTVTLDLLINGQTIPLGTGTVGPNGTVTVTVNGTTISSLPPGQYQLIVNFNAGAGSPNSSGSTTTTLNILPSAQTGGTTTTATPTSVLPGNGVSNFLGGPTTIPVVVNSLLGPVPEGTVTITLLTPTGSLVIGSGPVSGGSAAVPVTVPAGLLPGYYSMIESYSDNGTFLGSTATGTLTVQPLNPLAAALELAIDAAMLANMGNPGSVGELQLFSQVFLHQAVPTSIPQLLSNIQSLLPQTGNMFFPALGFAEYLDTDLPLENPMR